MNGKRRIKRIICILFSVLLMVQFVGCDTNSEKNKKSQIKENSFDKKQEKPKGRYVDEKIVLPEEYINYNITSMNKGKDDTIEFYGMAFDEIGCTIKKLIYQENKWSEENLDCFSNVINGLTPNIVKKGEDGNYYMLAVKFDEETWQEQKYFFKGDSLQGQAEEMPIKIQETIEKSFSTIIIDSFFVREDGMIFITSTYPKGKIFVYSADGILVKELDGSSAIAFENEIAYIGNYLETGIYTTTLDEKLQEISTEVTMDKTKIVVSETGIYLANKMGVIRKEKNGSIWQLIVDGSLTSMSDETLNLIDFVVKPGKQEEYFVLYNNRLEKTLLRIYYDEEMPAVPEDELSVYSLYDNPSIRQAILKYQKENNIRVNYTVVMDKNTTTSAAENIKVLNTELLSDNGADILVLDGLPIDSYIKKGVIADLTDLLSEELEKEEFVSSIVTSYAQDNRLYMVPMRFSIPLYYGKSEVIEKMSDLDALSNYINKNQQPVFKTTTHEALARTFFLLYKEQLFDSKNILNQEKLVWFMEKLNIISKNIGAIPKFSYSNLIRDISITGNNELVNLGSDLGNSLIDIINNRVDAAISQIFTFDDISYPFTCVKNYNLAKMSADDRFIPNVMVGINASTKKRRLAENFITMLLSPEIQDVQLEDGFPVRISSLNKMVDKIVQGDERLSSIRRNEDVIYLYQLQKEDKEEILEMIKQLKTPIIYDTLLYDDIIQFITDYLAGSITVQQAAQNIMNQMNTYLLE